MGVNLSLMGGCWDVMCGEKCIVGGCQAILGLHKFNFMQICDASAEIASNR